MTDYSKHLYNSLVETSMRVLRVLQAFDRRLSVDDIRVFEILAVYGEDVGYGKSLQQMGGGRFYAYGWRGALVQEAVDFLILARLVEGDQQGGYRLVVPDDHDLESFVGQLGGDYDNELEEVCDFMALRAGEIGFETYVTQMRAVLEAGLLEEIDMPPDPIETDSYVRLLVRDYWRMLGLRLMAAALARHAASLPLGLHPCLDPDWLKGLEEAARLEMVRVLREEAEVVAFRKSLGYPPEEERAS